jgi:hypothetical protein
MKGEVLDPDGDKVRHVDVPISFRDFIFFWSIETWMGDNHGELLCVLLS